MAISDEELVRQLESVPMVEPPDMSEAVMARVAAGAPARWARGTRAPTRTLALGLAWAAAIAIVVGIAFWRAPSPQSSTATMTAVSPSLDIHRDGDRWIVQPNVPGAIEWDHTKLSKVQTLPDGTVILVRRPGASGAAEIRLRVSGKEVVTTSVAVN